MFPVSAWRTRRDLIDLGICICTYIGNLLEDGHRREIKDVLPNEAQAIDSIRTTDY